MTQITKIFVCEFITAGGFSGDDLPPGLVTEGALMRDQLCNELMQTGLYVINTMHDRRLTPNALVDSSKAVDSTNFKDCFTASVEQSDFVWLIAPETDDVLVTLSQCCFAMGKPAIGGDLETIKAASNKLETAKLLTKGKLPTPKTLSVASWVAENNSVDKKNKWLAKPVDGVGCEGIEVFSDADALNQWLAEQTNVLKNTYFIQAFQQGVEASLSILCHDGKGWLLSCNRLNVVPNGDKLLLDTITINGFKEHWSLFEKLAEDVAALFPNMRGYLGIDAMFDVEASSLTILEINARLTSSYIGLSEATGLNMAQCMMDCATQSQFTLPNIEKNIVTIHL